MAININIPSQVKTYANLAGFPVSGSLKTIYIAEDTNKTYRWTGSVYVEISATAASTWGAIGGTLSNQTDLQTALNGKVNTEVGKGLSTNDYTTTEKNKLAGIASGAEVNVNADWNATTGDAEILNKPTIPSIAGLATTTYVDSQDATKQDTLVSGTSIKTVNSTSLLGSGDVAVQATLVSGTNIKTVNSTSLLGSGDVSVGVTSVTGTSPISSSGGATPDISIATANTTTTGALSSTDWNTFNGKQNALTLTTTGTSGAATLVGSTLNIPQYSGGGGGGTIYKLTSQTLTSASWVLSGGYYTYTFSNVNITTNTRVDFTPDNASYTEVTNCGMTPQVTVAAGSCTFYSLFPPQNNITGEVTIFPTL